MLERGTASERPGAATTIRSNERSTAAADEAADHGLKRNSLGAAQIVFYIVAAASPLTGVVALVPIMIGTGNGVGTPGSFVIAAAILLLFAVGYLATSRHVSNAGALYAYVTLGLGRVAGLGSASVTVLAYSCIQFSLYGGFGYYAAALIGRWSGMAVPWWLCAFVAMGLCLALGLRGVHAGGAVLGVLIVLELSMLALLGAGSLFSSDTTPVSQFSLEPFSIPAVFAAGVGIAIMFAHTTFIGFEGSAIYSEEAKDSRRTVPRATYFSVLFMGAVYAGTSYLAIEAVGEGSAAGIAQREGGDFIFYVADRALGTWASELFQVFIVTAIFAAIVTFHNNLSRYLYSLGRQGLISEKLAYTGTRRQTPYVAAITQTMSAIVVVMMFAMTGLDPYTTLFTWLAGLGTIAIILAQTIAAVAIIAFFVRTKVDTRIWHTRIAPVLALVGLIGLLGLALSSTDLLLGFTGWGAALLLSTIVIALAIGVGSGLWLRARSPEKYERMQVMLCEQD